MNIRRNALDERIVLALVFAKYPVVARCTLYLRRTYVECARMNIINKSAIKSKMPCTRSWKLERGSQKHNKRRCHNIRAWLKLRCRFDIFAGTQTQTHSLILDVSPRPNYIQRNTRRKATHSRSTARPCTMCPSKWTDDGGTKHGWWRCRCVWHTAVTVCQCRL